MCSSVLSVCVLTVSGQDLFLGVDGLSPVQWHPYSTVGGEAPSTLVAHIKAYGRRAPYLSCHPCTPPEDALRLLSSVWWYPFALWIGSETCTGVGFSESAAGFLCLERSTRMPDPKLRGGAKLLLCGSEWRPPPGCPPNPASVTLTGNLAAGRAG